MFYSKKLSEFVMKNRPEGVSYGPEDVTNLWESCIYPENSGLVFGADKKVGGIIGLFQHTEESGEYKGVQFDTPEAGGHVIISPNGFKVRWEEQTMEDQVVVYKPYVCSGLVSYDGDTDEFLRLLGHKPHTVKLPEPVVADLPPTPWQQMNVEGEYGTTWAELVSEIMFISEALIAAEQFRDKLNETINGLKARLKTEAVV